jgi:hypothetical protein
VFLVLENFCQIFTQKDMISTSTKDFPWGKKWPKFAIFQNFKNSKSPKSFNNFQKVAKNIRGFCFLPPPPPSYLFCSQNLAKLFPG